MNDTATQGDRPEGLLTPKEAAARLRMHVKSVRRSCRAGRIPSRRIGGRLFIPESALHIPAVCEPQAAVPAESPAPTPAA